jgi:hypothetical protein
MDLASCPHSTLQRLIHLSEQSEGLAEAVKVADRRIESLRQVLSGRTSASRDAVAEAKSSFDSAFKQTNELKARATTEAAILTATKQWVGNLPHNSKLEQISPATDGHTLADVRQRLAELRDRKRELEQVPMPRPDLREALQEHVAELYSKARPILEGLSGGPIRTWWPTEPAANRFNRSGFSDYTANGYLMACWLHPEHVTQALYRDAMKECSRICPPNERPAAIAKIEQQIDELLYLEAALIERDLAAGQSPVRAIDSKPQHVLLVRVLERGAQPREATAA